MSKQQTAENAEIELAGDEIDSLVYEAGPDADHDRIAFTVERIIAARIGGAVAVLREGLADEALEATGVMERALDALTTSPAGGEGRG